MQVQGAGRVAVRARYSVESGGGWTGACDSVVGKAWMYACAGE